MEDKTLKKIALIGAIAGIIVLFILSEKLGVSQQVISRLDELPEGKEVEVLGVVTRVHDAGNVMFLEIAQERIDKTTVVLFRSGNVSIYEGDVVKVTGSLEEYKGKKEIIGNRVEKYD